MATLAFAAPLIPGGNEAWRQFSRDVLGPRRAEYDDFHRRVGITTENWYLQGTPMGDMGIVYLEGENPAGAIQLMGRSSHPFDSWFREMARRVHGIDFSKPLPGPLPEVLLESGAGPAHRTLAFAAPTIPGGTEAFRRIVEEVQGPWKGEFLDFHHRLGLTVENWYLQPTPAGDIAINYLGGDDPARSIQLLGMSDHSFDRWFKTEVKKIHGIDFNQPPPGPLPEVLNESSTPLVARSESGRLGL